MKAQQGHFKGLVEERDLQIAQAEASLRCLVESIPQLVWSMYQLVNTTLNTINQLNTTAIGT